MPQPPVDLMIRGLARNPATPVDLLLRLVAAGSDAARAGFRQRRELPPAVQQAMARHPDRLVRSALAGHAQVDPELLRGLIADPDWRVLYTTVRRPRLPPLADDAVTDILTRIAGRPAGALLTAEEFYAELQEATAFDPRLDRLAVAHPDPRVRLLAAANAASLEEPGRAALLADPEPEVRAATTAAIAAAQRRWQPADLPDQRTRGYWILLQRPCPGR